MTSPVGHSLAGLAVGGGIQWRRQWPLALLLLFSANAADLDFLPGLIAGDANRYHHLASHSLAAAVLYALLAGLMWRVFSGCDRSRALQVGLLAGLAYATHLLLDWFTVDGGEPWGMQLLWPFSDGFFMSDVPFFLPVEHGTFGDPLPRVAALFLSPVNCATVALEIAVLGPVLLLGRWWAARRAGRRSWSARVPAKRPQSRFSGCNAAYNRNSP